MSKDERIKNILITTSTFSRWSNDNTPLFIDEYAHELSKYYRVYVLAPHYSGAAKSEYVKNIHITRFIYFLYLFEKLAYGSGILPNIRKNPLKIMLVPFFVASQFFYTLKIVLDKEIDVIHAHWILPQGLIAIVVAKLIRKKLIIVCTAHGSDLNHANQLWQKVCGWVLKQCHKVTTVSYDLKNKVLGLGVGVDQVKVISMGVNTDIFYPPSLESKREGVLFVGRMISVKGVDVLLRAMQQLLCIYPQLTLTLAGDGADLGALKRLAHDLGVSKSIVWLGAVAHAELGSVYRKAQIFASATRSEGFGLTVAEAMACGCAVVVSDVEGVKDLLEDDVTGLLFPVDDCDALVNQVKRMLEDVTLRNRLTTAGQQHIALFYSWGSVGKKYRDFIEKV